MSEQTNYCTTKGLGWAFLIVSAFILLVPMGMTYVLDTMIMHVNKMTSCYYV